MKLYKKPPLKGRSKQQSTDGENRTLTSLQMQVKRVGDLLGQPNSYVTSAIYFDHFREQIKFRGTNDTLVRFKYYYDSAKNLCLHTSEPDRPSKGGWVKTGKDGIPSFIKKVMNQGNIDLDRINDCRYLLTLFSSFEAMTVTNPKADLKSLMDPVTSEWTTGVKHDFLRFLEQEKFISNLSGSVELKSVEDYVSLKGGPFGPATPAWTQDFYAILNNPEKLSVIIELEQLIGNPERSSLSSIMSLLNLSQPEFTGMLAKQQSEIPLLVTQGIPDKGPKVRTITKGNYYIQRVLKPIHNYVMSVLKLIPEDGTYMQDTSANRVKQWTKSGVQPYCFDLTAATDRFPMWIQTDVLNKVLPSVSNNWSRLIGCSRSYSQDHKKYFNFEVGQPMGLFSSWPVFTLTHHYVLRYAFYLEKVSPKGAYSIIGDDIVILNKNVALTYKSLIEGLGVKISKSKSITPLNSDPSTIVGEMAKRLFRNGIEMSPLRPNDLISLRNESFSWMHIKDFCLQIMRRWEDLTWKLLYDGDSDSSSSNVSVPILTFLKASGKHRRNGRDLLESPLGGPRIRMFMPIDLNQEGNRTSLIDPRTRINMIKVIPSFWEDYSNSEIRLAKNVMLDRRLDDLLQKVVDIKETASCLSDATSESDVFVNDFKSMEELHNYLWLNLDINPLFRSLDRLKGEIEDILEVEFLFRITDAEEIFLKINNIGIQLDLIYDWLSGKIKRDISNSISKKRKVSATNMLTIKSLCVELKDDFVDLDEFELPFPSDFDGEDRYQMVNKFSVKFDMMNKLIGTSDRV
jgi:hypothetical protein